MKKITCNNCDKTFTGDKDTRICSNCFGCVDCEEYLCPYCDSVITIKPPKHTGNGGNASDN